MSQQWGKEEQVDSSKSRWIEDTHEARRDVMEVRREIPAELVNCEPFDVPQIVDFYNRLVHEYAEQLRPKCEDFQDLWGEQLTTVKTPPDGVTVHAGQADHFGAIDEAEAIRSAEWESRPVSLESLDEWKHGSEIRLTLVANDASRGVVDTTVRKTLYLPPAAADRVVTQLNQCLNELGWLPEAEVQDFNAEEPL